MRWNWPTTWTLRKAARSVRLPEREVRVVVEEAPPVPEVEDDLLRKASDVAWRLLIIGVVIALILWGAIYIRVVTIPVILAVFVTALLMPPTQWLRDRGLGRGLSTTISVLGAVIIFGGVVTLIVLPAISGFDAIVASINESVVTLQQIAASFGMDDQLINEWIASAQQWIQRNSSQLISGAWAGAVAVGEVLVGIILVIVLTIYFVHSGDELMRWVRSLFPSATRRALRDAGELTYDVIGRYVRGVALVGLIDAIGIGAVLLFVFWDDLSLVMPLVILTFIGAFLPVIGAFLAGLVSVLVALVVEGLWMAVVVLAGTIAVQQLESHIIAPRIYGRSLELPSAVVLLSISVGSIIGGITGAFLATPVVAVLAVLLRNRPFTVEASAQEQETAETPQRPGAGEERSAAGARPSARDSAAERSGEHADKAHRTAEKGE
ncbi:conserved hypothetical protein [Thermobifida fusca YX]|uniref:Integral membrane protein n=1 Tax=Thermobifida fusca (strain YX) TaxID=269800 RepID=Q47NQ5_THEFY|nr:conserved hypothetical protein [Thermobifida fusca YX]PPS93628.1 hypothetical protein BH05_07235 [Thermobifida fusca]